MTERKILNIYDKHDLAKLLIGSVKISSPELSRNSLRQGIENLDFVYKKYEESTDQISSKDTVTPKVPMNGVSGYIDHLNRKSIDSAIPR